MGLLDDAIRQHLELKLAHGADAGTIEHEMALALGRVDRDRGAREAAAGDQAILPPEEFSIQTPAPIVDNPADEQLEYDEAAVRPDVHGVLPDEVVFNAPTVEPQVPEQPAPAEAPDEELPPGEDFPGFAGWNPDAMETPASHERVPGDPDANREPASKSAPDLHENLFGEHDELPAAAGAGEPTAASGEPAVLPGQDNLLEATPEFFEETAEYDKMWFEEKPPKDFDFGG